MGKTINVAPVVDKNLKLFPVVYFLQLLLIVDFDKDQLISLKVYWLDKIILSSYPLVSVSLVVFQAIIAFILFKKGPDVSTTPEDFAVA